MVHRAAVLAAFVTILWTPAAGAQKSPAQRFHVTGGVAGGADSLRIPNLARDTIAPSRLHHAKNGAIIGAASVGLIGAMLISNGIKTGCDTDSRTTHCSTIAPQLALMLYGFTLGAVGGGVTGSVIGFAWPVSRHRVN